MKRRSLLGIVGAGAASAAVGGCGAPARLAAPPEKLGARAGFPGMPEDCRVVLDGSNDRLFGRIAFEALRREVAYTLRRGGMPGSVDFLAISGGGENGAFGAGLLTAWTQLGSRPAFKGVTGVSTGALTAPFAFLGPDYDGDLERVYTDTGAADVMTSRGLVAGLLGDSLYDSAPLLRLIRRFVTPAFLAAIAREYTEKGRLLFVATANLDVPVGVLWNMGSIAASGHARAAELFARILLASASIPGILPPVMFDIEVGGERYQEMHVDGGTLAQVVLYPPSLGGDDVRKEAAAAAPRAVETLLKRKRRLFIIRNARPGGNQETVERSTIVIADRAVATLIQSQGLSDLYQLYVIARRDGIDYNVAYIPESFTDKIKEPFDQAYMRRLYAVGREAMLNGLPWQNVPPGFNPTPIHRLAQASPR
ncbi:MAG: patatin-like phospholipase family protein [Reyranella sp.]|nr:patatin-like phospholipase family protein [Reyranella sp.]